MIGCVVIMYSAGLICTTKPFEKRREEWRGCSLRPLRTRSSKGTTIKEKKGRVVKKTREEELRHGYKGWGLALLTPDKASKQAADLSGCGRNRRKTPWIRVKKAWESGRSERTLAEGPAEASLKPGSPKKRESCSGLGDNRWGLENRAHDS
ncbi:hypothetical protein BDW74DRAFT_163075 [Aspergillus multicolor]|uniref:uncharacterized protein n=1 Tax=Aspergillus multicolor TaxID=41759 RepID=UPI003CCDDD5F